MVLFISFTMASLPGNVHAQVFPETLDGIPLDQQERVFEKFAQAGIRAEGQRAGVGLGLTYCKLAVEAHRGRIWVESDQGVGTTFHFVLPVWVGDEAQPNANAAPKQ